MAMSAKPNVVVAFLKMDKDASEYEYVKKLLLNEGVLEHQWLFANEIIN